LYEKQCYRVFNSQRSRYQPYHYRHLQDQHSLRSNRNHDRRHIDGLGHYNRVDFVSITDASSTSPTQPAQAQAPAQSQAQSQPSSKPTLKLIHLVGTKYIDYFTDGTKTYSFPGNPDIDSNLNKPNAPIPSHGNLKWVSTSGMDAYDTPSGDLEIGDYAQQADGTFITNVPAYTCTDATSSVPIPAHIATSKTDPTVTAQ